MNNYFDYILQLLLTLKPMSMPGLTEEVMLAAVSCAIFFVVLLLLMAATNPLSFTLYISVLSLLISLMYLLLDAPDVALTEAAINVCLTMGIFLLVLFVIGSAEGKVNYLYQFCGGVAALILFMVMSVAFMDMPDIGSAQNPLMQYLGKYYIENTTKDIGIPSTVAAILASYRGFDTFGEVLVVSLAGFSFLGVLANRKTSGVVAASDAEEGADLQVGKINNDIDIKNKPVQNATEKGTDRIFLYAADMLLPLAVLAGVYLQFNGEVSPGGGFQAGAVLASLFMGLDLMGVPVLHKKAFLEKLIAIGAGIYLLTGLLCLACGGRFLDYDSLQALSLPSPQHAGIIMIEVGVGIAVMAVLSVIYIKCKMLVLNSMQQQNITVSGR